MINLKDLNPFDRLDALWAWLMRGGKDVKVKQLGAGEVRAKQRLAKIRAKNAKIPFEPVITRQQMRRYTILKLRQARQTDLRKKEFGGQATRPSWRFYGDAI